MLQGIMSDGVINRSLQQQINQQLPTLQDMSKQLQDMNKQLQTLHGIMLHGIYLIQLFPNPQEILQGIMNDGVINRSL